ncbi:hypothetical protein LDENG_00219010 [Lucifuga dentata]|nr:hypothetical protein LDENG_00219010 [Lucifuga dentata]
MYRAPLRPQPIPGASRAAGRFPSSIASWGFPGSRSPSAGVRYGASPRGSPAGSPGSPRYSPASHRPYRGCSPAGFSSNSSRGFGDSPRGFGSGGRGFRGKDRGRTDVLRRLGSYSPASARSFQAAGSDSVEKYFSPSMLQDPWISLQPHMQLHAGSKQQPEK